MSRKNDNHRLRGGKYSDPSPYPEIKVAQPNLQYAEVLMDDYAGRISEFSAISQYLYHHYFFNQIDNQLGELLESISIVEMHHMNILAETIIKLGGNPEIRGSNSTYGHYWNAGYINYGTTLCEQLKADIDSEYKAIEAYNRHISIIQDSYIQAILHRIILDEKVHIHYFNLALSKFCGYIFEPLP